MRKIKKKDKQYFNKQTNSDTLTEQEKELCWKENMRRGRKDR